MDSNRAPGKDVHPLPDIILTVSIKAEYWNGVFKPLERVSDSAPGMIYQVFSEDELRQLAEDLPWLKGSERSFEFWENKEDAVYDKL